jgi:hypothetical protein
MFHALPFTRGGPLADQDYGRLLRRVGALAARRPRLVPTLLAAAWKFRARDWYRRPPFLPLPPADYVAWRLYTAFGSETALPEERQLAAYLRWAAAFGKRIPAEPRTGSRTAQHVHRPSHTIGQVE